MRTEKLAQDSELAEVKVQLDNSQSQVVRLSQEMKVKDSAIRRARFEEDDVLNMSEYLAKTEVKQEMRS